MKSLGQVAFETFRELAKGDNQWEDLAPVVQSAWQGAAQAIVDKFANPGVAKQPDDSASISVECEFPNAEILTHSESPISSPKEVAEVLRAYAWLVENGETLTSLDKWALGGSWTAKIGTNFSVRRISLSLQSYFENVKDPKNVTG